MQLFGLWTVLSVLLVGEANGNDTERTDQPNNPEYLLMTNGTSVVRIRVPGDDIETVHLEDVQKISQVADDSNLGLMFMAGTFGGRNGIFRATSDGQNITLLVHDIGHVAGLAAHSATNLLYWTDDDRNTIESVDYTGANRMLLVDTDVWWPQGVVLDPDVGWMFWYDQGNSCLRRAQMDGSDRHTLLCNSLLWLNQLSLNIASKSLYWVDEHNATVTASDYNGQNIRLVADFSQRLEMKGPLRGVAPTVQGVYFTSGYKCVLYRLIHENGNKDTYKTVATLTGNADSCLLFYASKETQDPPTDTTAMCSHIKLTTGPGTFKCACPTYGGLILGSDNLTCIVTDHVILYTDEHNGKIGFMDPNRLANDDYHLIAKSPKPVAIGYDPHTGYMYWSDLDVMAIYRSTLDGKNKEVFIGKDEGIGIVDGLAVDWQSRRIYFTNRGFSAPKADGNVYSWSRIEMVGLDRDYRRSLVAGTDKPRALALDMINKHLYYTEWGKEPKVVRVNLDGSDQLVIRYSSISNPNGLDILDNKLYLLDSNYNKDSGNAFLGVYNIVDESWNDYQLEAKTPFGVAVAPAGIFVADWGGTGYQKGGLWIMKGIGQEMKPVLPNLSWGRPTGLFRAELTSKERPTAHDCSLACDGLCVKHSGGDEVCVCPDGSAKIASQGTACTVPMKFLLFGDMNTINIVSLDDAATRENRVVHYGSSEANYVALALDQKYLRLFFSDLTTGGVRSKRLEHSTNHVEIIYKGCQVVDCMIFDQEKRNLLFTCHDTHDPQGAIKITSFVNDVMSEVDTLIVTHGRPRALANNQNYVFWSEYGGPTGKSRVMKAALEGGDRVTLIDKGLRWPNSLIVDGNWLLVADGGLQKIIMVNIENGTQSILHHLPDHVFGMTLVGTSIYYTSWFSQNIAKLDLVTKRTTAVLHNLVRPTHIEHGDMRVINKENNGEPNYLTDILNLKESDTIYSSASPIIHGCPDNEMISLVLPPGANSTFLNISLRAVDGLGAPLALSGTHPVPPGTQFMWRGHGAEAHQFVHYSSTDSHGVTVSCDFIVTVVDREPPKFTHCTRSMTHNTTLDATHAYWKEPLAVDNVGVVELTVEGATEGSSLLVGAHNVTYVALDGDRNTAECYLTVTINKIDISCLMPPLFTEPNNGALRCRQSQTGHTCNTECEPRRQVLNVDSSYHHVSCSENGTWSSWFPKDYSRNACRRISVYRHVEQSLSVGFHGECLHRETAIIQILSRVIDKAGKCGHDYTLCYKSSLHLACNYQEVRWEVKNGRRRREVDAFSVKITLSKTLRLDQLETIEPRIQRMLHTLKLLFSNATFLIQNDTVTSSIAYTKILPLEKKCTEGNEKMGDFCVACPADTYYSAPSAECKVCPPGSIQPKEAQTECVPCQEYNSDHLPFKSQSPCPWTFSLKQKAVYLSAPVNLTWPTISGLLSVLVLCLIFAVIFHRWRRGNHVKIVQQEPELHEEGYDKDTTVLQTISTPEPKRPRRAFPYLQQTPYTRV